MNKKKNSLGDALVVGTALAGAALGAAAVMLSDKKNQEKIKKTVDGISDEAVKLGKNIKKKADEMTQKNEKIIAKAKKEAVEKVEKEALKKASPTAKKIYTTAKPVVKAAAQKK